jgi:hypothetical protein
LPSRVSEDELTRHSEFITQLGAAPVWKKFDPLT